MFIEKTTPQPFILYLLFFQGLFFSTNASAQSDSLSLNKPHWGVMASASVLDRDIVRIAPTVFYHHKHHGFYLGPELRIAEERQHNLGLTGGYLFFPIATPHRAEVFLEYSFSVFHFNNAFVTTQLAGIGYKINFDGHFFIQQSVKLGMENLPATAISSSSIDGVAQIRFGIGYIFKYRSIPDKKEKPAPDETK